MQLGDGGAGGVYAGRLAGSAHRAQDKAANMPMIEIVTINSMSVKPEQLRLAQ